MRGELLEERIKEERIPVIECPEIYAKIEGLPVTALVDSGAKVTVMSEEFFLENQEALKDCPTLPVTGCSVKGAIRGKACKVKKQIMAETKIGNIKIYVSYLIVPGLIRDILLGVDTLHPLKSLIDIGKETLKVKYNEQTEIISTNKNPTKEKEGAGGQSSKEKQEVKERENGEKKLYVKEQIVKQANGSKGKEKGKRSHEEKNRPYEKEEEEEKELSLEQLYDYEEEDEINREEIEEKLNENGHLNTEQKETLRRMIWKHRRAFLKRPGRIKNYYHTLRVNTQEPIVAHAYPIPFLQREKVDAEIEKLLMYGIIQRSTSPWVNPLVVVTKKDKSIRLCLDARKLNEVLVDDHESTITIDEIFAQCHSVQVMTSLDLTSSFWQIPLHPECTKYTAFRHRGKIYEFTVTPFGLKTSTASLLRALEVVLQNTGDHVLNFVDDLLCVSKDFNEHIRQLDELLVRLEQHGLTVNLQKAKFFRQEIEFLGHVLTTNGIKPQEKKIEAIKNFPAPKNVKQLRGFLGLVNYYTKFTSKHAEETFPLLELIRKGVKWKWGEREEIVFKKVKGLFIEEVLLMYPDPRKGYILQTDASQFALGGTLAQINEKKELGVVVFGSRTLKGAEVNYTTTEKELLAIVWTLKKFRTYLFGAKILIRTDHKALTFLKNCKLLNERLQRWVLAIQDYHLTFEHCIGTRNIVADVLSRMEPRNTGGIRDREVIISSLLAKKPSKELRGYLTNLYKWQHEDNSLGKIIQGLNNDHLNTKYTVKNKILVKYDGNQKWKIALPTALLSTLIKETHEIYGHIGAKKVWKSLSEDFTHPRFHHQVRKILATCDSCQRNKVPNQHSYAAQQNITPKKPGELVSIDFFGPLPTGAGGCRYILVTLDAFTKFVKLYPLKAATAVTTINRIFNDYIPTYGKPEALQFDHGTQFTSTRWLEKLASEGIRPIFSSIRHPQGNIVERVNREISRFFRTFLTTKHSAWVTWIKVIETCINEIHHDTTELTPLELQTKSKPTRIWQKWVGIKAEMEEENGIEVLVEMARKRIQRKGKQRAERFNRGHKLTEFKEGELVLAKACNVSDPLQKTVAKFLSIYEGPYIIKKKIAAATYILIYPKNRKERGMYHAANLKKYNLPGDMTTMVEDPQRLRSGAADL